MTEVLKCSKCGKSNLWVMSPIRYIFFTSTLPVLAALLFGFLADPVFFLFIPAVILTNHLLAKKKTPLKICKDCKHTENNFSHHSAS
ncbi:hypothetical protein [Alteribacillus bidgolensis]|uniref:Uncharacterized protein n=1 Tax=Alteribacillus bidgolensis TaxID=930129 RepID=A0A1G8M4M7_9BACI|nr:hypothetical protein [Alteribacillus bidgolensis]SDI62757.1 hypothetical protein SAMN05216352_109204 [Alteribacillus bidgolensis]